MSKEGRDETIITPCPFTHGINCGLSVQVTNGVIKKVRPADSSDRRDRGACAIGLATREMVYHPDRLRYPLKRVGQRGEGKWQRVSWDEALGSIVARLQELTLRYGSTSIAWGAQGSLTNLRSGGYSRLVSLTKGTWVNWLGFGDSAGPCADRATFGYINAETHLSHVRNPKLSIAWGRNPASTDYTRMRTIMEDKRKGCKLVVIDPRFTSTASRADEHIAIRPGTDGALALAMIRTIVERELQDEPFIIEHTIGPLLVRSDNGLLLREGDIVEGGSQQRFIVFDDITGRPQPCDIPGIKPRLLGGYLISGIECRPAFQLLVDVTEEYTLEKASEITDIPAHVIERLAVSYATQKPASIHRGWGLQRTFHGELVCRAIYTLAAITGNINVKRHFTFVLNWRPFALPEGPYNEIPVMLLYDAIAKGEPMVIKALWLAGHNFINQMPDMNKFIREVLPNLELVVVCDLFMTATARYADYVLPVCSSYECLDLCALMDQTFAVTTSGNTYMALQQKIIEPLYESKSDFQIAAELGRRMGFAGYFDRSEEQCIEQLLSSEHPSLEGINFTRLKEGPVQVEASDRPKRFRTPTGRIEFYNESLKQFGQELPIHIEPVEGKHSEEAKRYPLSLLSTHSRNRILSNMAIIQSLLKFDPEPLLEINPVDAEQRSILDGDIVTVFNDRGMVKLKAKLSPQIKPGVVNIMEGWWPEQYIEGHHNQLTHNRINPVQQFIFEPNVAFYDVQVEVKKSNEQD